MPRFLSFMIFVFLQLTVVLTKSIHSMVINVCYTIENLFQLNSAFIDNISDSSKTEKISIRETLGDTYVEGVTVSTQTALANIFPEFMNKKGSDTDILIYNLSPARKITITHENLKRNCTKSNNCKHCERFKPVVEKLNDMDSQTDNPSFETGDTFNVNKSEFSQNINFTSSSMSIEKDTTNSQIILNSRIAFPDTKLLNEEIINKSTQYSSCHNQNDANIISEFVEGESQENDENMPLRELSGGDEKEDTVQRQTSSPIDDWLKRPSADQRAEFGISFSNHQKTAENDKIHSKIPKSVDELHTSDQFDKRNSLLESTILLDDKVKQRLSLSPNTKSSAVKAAALSLKSIQDEIIEYAKKTPRCQMNIKEIKFPYTPEIQGIFQTIDDREEAKEIFSCSSYESLPVSDHMRTVFEKGVFSSLYTENFANLTEPDFSSVDSLVEAFRKFESTFSLYEPTKTEMSKEFASFKSSKKMFGRNLSVEFLEIDKRQSQPNIRKALSSGMLYNCTSSQHCHKKDKLYRDSTGSEYQNSNNYLFPVYSTNFKSRTSSLSSIPNGEISMNETKGSEYDYKKEKFDCEQQNTLDKTTVYSKNDEKNLAAEVLCLNIDKQSNECKTGTVECNESHSDSAQFIEIQNLPETLQENGTVTEESAEKIDSKSLAMSELTEAKHFMLSSSKQKRVGKSMYARKSFTCSKNKIDQGTSTFSKPKSPEDNINISFEENCKLENSKTSSKINSDTFQELQKNEKIEEKDC